MAKKATLKKTVSYYSKADHLFLQRSGGQVYIAEEYSTVTVPNVVYETYFCTVSPRFPLLQDGEMLKSNSKKTLPTPNGMDLAKIFPLGVSTIQRLGIAKVISISNSEYAEVFRLGNQLIYLNSKFIAIAYELATFCDREGVFNSSFKSTVGAGSENQNPKTSPVIWDWQHDCSMMLFPIRSDSEWLSVLNSVNVKQY